jgi:translation initiation factor 1A
LYVNFTITEVCCDRTQRYTPDEARDLKAYGELPDWAKINETDTANQDEFGIEFGEGSDDDESGSDDDVDIDKI